jgi:DNA-binding LytR/AlgR family response regulator
LNQAHVVIVEDEPLARRRLRRLTGVAGKRTTHKKI